MSQQIVVVKRFLEDSEKMFFLIWGTFSLVCRGREVWKIVNSDGALDRGTFSFSLMPEIHEFFVSLKRSDYAIRNSAETGLLSAEQRQAGRAIMTP